MSAREIGMMLTMAALWGGSYLFIRVGAPALGPLPLMGGRVALAALVLAVVLRALRQRVVLRPYAGRLLVLGLLNAALPFTLLAYAELRLTASFVAVLGATVPLFGALLGAVFLDEAVTRRRGVGLLLGLAGVAVLTGWSPVALDGAGMLSIGATLVASAAYAAAGVYSKRQLSGVPAATLALGQQLGALAWLAIPAALFLPAARPTGAAIGALASLAVFSTALAFVIFFRLLELVGPTRTQTVTYIVPVFGMMWGALFLGERVTGAMLAGFGFIAFSMVLVNGIQLRLPVRRARLAVGRS